MARWLLPENISDVLPEEARTVEHVRRDLLDLYHGYGYELVIPPLMEYIDSLLTGSAHDLDLSTLKMIDQGSGRTLGLRADCTPQVARIDSHILNRVSVVRLCYVSSCVRAVAPHPLASREPLQMGAEIYGDPSLTADQEILELAIGTVSRLRLKKVCIDMGHTAIVRALFAHFGVKPEQQTDIVAALASKDASALQLATATLETAAQGALLNLLSLHGPAQAVLANALSMLPNLPAIHQALLDLGVLARHAQHAASVLGYPAGQIECSVDLADTHGFGYHTGMTFAAFVPGLASALLRGGRYDDVGAAYGRARPATGFSLLDLREAAALVAPIKRAAIWAPAQGDEALEQKVRELRQDGHIVVRAGHEPLASGPMVPGIALSITHILSRQALGWELTPFTS